MRPAAILILALTTGNAARAGDFSVGLGYDHLFGQGVGAAAFGVQVSTDPLWHLCLVGFGLGAAGEADTEGDLWAGGGLTATWPLGARWRIGGSVMAGFYALSDGGDDRRRPRLRPRVPHPHRRQPEISPLWRLGLAVEHKSNGGIGEINPGIETFFLVLSRRF